MILVRNVFQLEFGKTREAVPLFKEGLAQMQKLGFGRGNARLLTDAVSTFYTVVLEQTFPSLAEYESQAQRIMADKDWKAFYQKLTPLIESGHREIFTIVE